nr:hypothetical protein [uncultured Acetatifactor sp.]
MQKEQIEQTVTQVKKAIAREMARKKYDDALGMISACAFLLYHANIYYTDRDLEDGLALIARTVQDDACNWQCDSEIALFYDGFGLNERGLAQIYLRALCKAKNTYYVTYDDRKNQIPDILKILGDAGCHVRYISRRKSSHLKECRELQEIVDSVRPGHFFFYSTPDDVVGTTVLYANAGRFTRYQVNLTDHAFWLGTHCIDRCIEFRPYGVNVSMEYRGIPEDRIIMVPFYPIIHKDVEFGGFPFPVAKGQKVIFSGGSLYKTLGKGNEYYRLIEYILSEYPEAVFWYAGSGDSTEMDKLIKRFPDRLYLTEERKDLHQVLCHCHFYLSTYPICGGLMFQYAAVAERIPLTLRNGNITDGFLLEQNSLGIVFDDVGSVKREIDHIMYDEEYVREKGNRLKNAVISEERFDAEIAKLVNHEDSGFVVVPTHTDTAEFRKVYLDNLTEEKVNEILARKDDVALCKYMPFRYFCGGIGKIRKKIKRMAKKPMM